MFVDILEPRSLLAATASFRVTHSGVLQYNGSSDADRVAIEIVNGRVMQSKSVNSRTDAVAVGVPAGTRVKRVRVDLSGGSDTLNIKSDVGTIVEGKAGRDSVTIDARNATVLGGSGDDTLRSIQALFDKDVAQDLMKNGMPSVENPEDYDVFAGSGNTLGGGPGDDVLYSRGGDDVLVGGSGFDRFIGASDDITVYNSRQFPFGRAAAVTTWKSNAMVVEVEEISLTDSDRPVRAYF